jgi:16S rRNA processing protein RimM
VGKPHGNDGAFTVSEPTERLELLDVGRTVAVGGREIVVASRGGTAPHPLVTLVGVESRGAADAFRGQEITVPRSAIGALEEGEYLADDLIGCEAFDGVRRIGRVRDVLLLPSADVLEVERDGGEPLLVPLVADAVRGIDVAAGRVDIDTAFLDDAA